MRTSSLSIIIVVLVIVLGLGYALLRAVPSASDVTAKVTELSGGKDVEPLQTDILTGQDVQDVLANHRIFGTRPVDPPSEAINRRNPFEGI